MVGFVLLIKSQPFDNQNILNLKSFVQMVLDNMAAIYKWSGFWIADPIQNPYPTSF